MTAATVHTFCRYCLASCGVEVTVENNQVRKISADKQNPHSWQDFCAKGRTADQVVEHPRRILNPMRRVGDSYVEATWDEAISDIAARMNALIDAGGPDAVGAYYGNPAGYSLSNIIFMSAWLDAVGTHSRYAVGSVDQNALHVVAAAMYGSQLMVPVSDVDNCDFFLLVGTNPAVSAWNWLETVPGGWRRALERHKRGATIVVVDPLRTETADKADLHLAVRPGQDWALLLAMVKVILDGGLEHRQDCTELATGVPELRRLVADSDLDDLAARCDIPRGQIEQVAREFACARGAMVITRTGISLHLAGTVGEWLGHVLNVITGRMDRPGGRRFEPGYVDALRLADLAKPKPHKSRLAGRDMVAGAHALSELPDEITTPGRGQIRAMVINSGNPVVSGPDGAKLDKALEQLDLLVAIDYVQRESHRHAHWLLPAVHWLERNDLLALTSSMHDEPYADEGRRAAARGAGGMANLRRPGAGHAQAAFRRQGCERIHQDHPANREDHAAAGPGFRSALGRSADSGDGTKSQRAQTQMARCDDASPWHGVGTAGVRALQGGIADRRQNGARCAARVRRARPRTARRTAPRGAGRLPVPAVQPAQPARDELVAQRAARPASRGQAKQRRHPSRGRGGPRCQRRRSGAGVLARRRDRARRVGQ